MELFLQTLANGVVLGSIYAVMAFGLTLVYGVMRVINFAHAVFAVLAAYLTLQIFHSLDMDPFVAITLTGPLFFILGWLIYRGFIARLGVQVESPSMVLTFGLGVVIEVVIILLWTTNFRSITPSYGSETFSLGPVRMSYPRIIGLALAVLLLGILEIFLKVSRSGRAIRAVMQDREAALYTGVDVGHICALTFAIATATAGGALLGTIYAFYPAVHLQWIGRLFAIVVLGGMGSIGGTFFAAYVLALAESLVSLYIGVAWSPVVAFLVIIGVLLYRPAGLMGQAVLTRG